MLSYYTHDNLISGKVESYATFWLMYNQSHRGIYISSDIWQTDIVEKMRNSKLFPIFRIAFMTNYKGWSERYIFQLCIFGYFFGVRLYNNKFSKIVLQRGLGGI